MNVEAFEDNYKFKVSLGYLVIPDLAKLQLCICLSAFNTPGKKNHVVCLSPLSLSALIFFSNYMYMCRNV